MTYRFIALLLTTAALANAASDVRPFAGNISAFKQVPMGKGVTVGNWVYAVSDIAPIMTNKHVRHSEFSPLGNFGDSNALVLGIRIAVRYTGQTPARFPSPKVITHELVGTNSGPQLQWLEYDQYSAGYIASHLTSAVVFDPGETLVGVVAFECCMNKGTQQKFLMVANGPRYHYLVSLDQPAPSPYGKSYDNPPAKPGILFTPPDSGSQVPSSAPGVKSSPAQSGLNRTFDALVFSGTATNTTNPRQHVTAPVRIVFDNNAIGTLTVSPPLAGSGSCQIYRYDLGSGRIDIPCKGPVNITWMGTIVGARVTGTYIVEPTRETGTFDWSISAPSDSQ